MSPAAAGYHDAADVTGPRQSVNIFLMGDTAMVGSKPGLPFGFTIDQARRAGAQFAVILEKLSRLIAGQQPDDTTDAAALQTSLSLSAKDRDDFLFDLMEIGGALRRDISAEMVAALQYFNFALDHPPAANEPALTFRELTGAPPILWDMMYEGDITEAPQWEQFWGFRLPITHWTNQDRTAKIRLRQGFFSALHEKLDFAGQEIELLHQKLGGLPHFSLADKMQHLVEQALMEELKLPSADVDTFWENCAHSWLEAFLKRHPDHDDWRKLKLWKDRQLKAIFSDLNKYDLMHFACHCRPAEETEFLSQLELNVAGADISINVALLTATGVRREWNSVNDPGPFVFLNACGTGQSGDSVEPPGFPEKWIEGQGALAVIATLCPVPDYFAHAFALKFYDTLFAALNEENAAARTRHSFLSEALLATRRHFMENYNNPLGLAYVLYAAEKAQILDEFGRFGGSG